VPGPGPQAGAVDEHHGDLGVVVVVLDHGGDGLEHVVERGGAGDQLEDGGLPGDEGLRPLLVADVAGGEDHPADLGVVEEVDGVDPDVDPAAVLVSHPGFGGDRPARLVEHLAHQRAQPGHVVGVHQLVEGAPDPRVRRVAEHRRDLPGRAPDRAVGPEDGDRVGDVLQEGAPAVLGGPHGPVDGHVLGDVDEQHEHLAGALGLVGGVAGRGGPHPQVDGVAGGVDADEVVALEAVAGEGAGPQLVAAVVEDGERAADDLLGQPAQHVLGGRVPEGDHVVGAHPDDGDGHPLDEAGHVDLDRRQGPAEAPGRGRLGDGDEERLDLAVGPHDGVAVGGEPAAAALPAHVRLDGDRGGVALGAAVEPLGGEGPVLGLDQVEQRAAHDLLGAEAEHGAQGGVHLGDHPVGADDGHRRVGQDEQARPRRLQRGAPEDRPRRGGAGGAGCARRDLHHPSCW
jgi:hypothetical protein